MFICQHSRGHIDLYFSYITLYQLLIERKVIILSYWLKIVHNESSCTERLFIISEIHKINSILCICNYMYVTVTRNALLKNWASLVKKLLCSKGCNETWLQQGVSNKHEFLMAMSGPDCRNVNQDYEIFIFKLGRR